MVKHTGHHPAVVVCPAKPIDTGFKLYVLAEGGYAFGCILHQNVDYELKESHKTYKNVMKLLLDAEVLDQG